MGLRCLIGHDFGEIQTERDRRERGEEAIVTVREFRECDRCGETRVVSENKEVRTTATMDRAEPPEPDDGPEPVGDDAGFDEPTEEFDDVSAEEDDGVILEDEPEERQPGEWPEDETRDSAEPGDEDESAPWPEAEAESGDADGGEDAGDQAPWPEVEGDDEGYAAEPSDGEDLDGVEFGSGLTPEAAAADQAGGSAVEDGEVVEATGGGGGFRRASPGPSPTGRQRPNAAETEFYCPECGFTTPTEDSSLRPGDICPSCRLGYLTERET